MLKDKNSFVDPTSKKVNNTVVIPKYSIILGDTHFGRNSNDPKELEESVEYFTKFFIPILHKLNEKFGKENVCVIQVGDIYDNKSSVGVLTGNHVIDIFAKIAEINKVFIVVGNHDTIYKEIREINNNKSLSLINNIEVITQLTEFKTVLGKTVYLMPNYDTKERLEIAVDNCESESFLFGHDEIAGFSYEGKLIKEGHSISATMFKKFKKVIFGHIHKSQEAENIIFVGSAYQTRMNEWQNICRILVMNFETEEISVIHNRFSPTYKRVNLFDLMRMKVSEANNLVNNSKIMVLCPNDSIIRIGTHKITPLLEGYRKLEYKPLYGDTSVADQSDLKQEMEDDNLESIELSSDLTGQIEEYIDSIDSIVLNKNLVTLNEKVKEKMKEKLVSLYKTASEVAKPTDQ